MSAIAGRVLIIPKGAYNANVTYHLLDAVFFNGSTYIAKDTTTGNPPSDTEHWQILAQGAQDAAAAVFFGTCITAGSSQNKEVSVEVADNFALKRGAIVGVKFTNTNTFVASAANHITLNVNSSGVYSIYYGASADPEGVNPVAFGEAGYINYYQFDGTHWTYVGRSGVQTAKQTPYDGTTSGLASDNVNDAIDETLDFAEDNISAIVNVYSSKNLNSYPYYHTTRTHNGITYTDNGDGTVFAGGQNAQTASGNSSFYCHDAESSTGKVYLKNGTYTINGCPSGGNKDSGYSIQLSYKDPSNALVSFYDIGNGETFTINGSYGDVNGAPCYFLISVKSGCTIPAGGLTFKPMIRDARISDDTYVPYVPTNRELMSYRANGILGAKNLLPYPYKHTTKTEYGITFTDNGDGSVTVSGTATGDAEFWIIATNVTPKYIELKDGNRYILSGCPSGGGSYYNITITAYINSAWVGLATDTGSGASFTYRNNTYLVIKMNINNGAVISTPITFKPMIRLASDPDNTFVPYAMTNRELTEDEKITELTSLSNYKGSTIDNIYGYAVKKGKMVSVSFWWHGSVNNNQPIITLPSEFRPTKNIYCGGEQIRTNDPASTPAFYIILPNGGIYQSITTTPCLEGSLSFTYAI